MAKHIYGLDLGSYEIKVYDKKQDTIWKEKNAIAVKNDKEIFAVGDDAYRMYEKSPTGIQVAFPMKEGVISRFNDMQYLLQNLLKKERRFARGAEYVIAVPTDVTEVEKKAFFDLVIHSTARAKEVNIVERGIADAIGLNLDIENTKGILIANFGGETTELSVISGGGIVFNRLVKVGGITFDQAIATLVHYNHDFLIGRLTSETLRKKFGVVIDDSSFLTVAGRDLITGLPQRREISSTLVRVAIQEPLKDCLRAIQSLLDRIPPEIRKAIYKNGIFLTGGGACLPGLDEHMENALGITVHTAIEPDICAVTGLKQIIMSKELKKLAYSMLNESYRWMR
ncbi:rod shape-determining protein [Dorea acetigenes]|jgi:rod shape-determining protein MreB|uniref:Cell shape-determining protein MreB n=1 Tax=Dorea acetigenes TaxID=2981787 RepID=A0ABT2RJB3_9FIRM|nr:rod shape-determining protein [Dorea acetigenes]MCB6413824.1 rod shape-determining protein [Faecalimonas umbilicata]MCU6685499.1 rod shape-determining protein [Dorea acetigenes]SCI53737.1 Rod shape-determining protein MreB [uncultured Clostridium sp.]